MLNEVVSYIEQCEASKPLVRPHLNPLHKPAPSARTPPVLVLLLYTLSTSCLPPKQARPSPPTPSRNPGHYGALSLSSTPSACNTRSFHPAHGSSKPPTYDISSSSSSSRGYMIIRSTRANNLYRRHLSCDLLLNGARRHVNNPGLLLFVVVRCLRIRLIARSAAVVYPDN